MLTWHISAHGVASMDMEAWKHGNITAWKHKSMEGSRRGDKIKMRDELQSG
jgi:hypothetical protein